MPIIFDITHSTHIPHSTHHRYHGYHQRVRLREHRLMFRPRGSHDLRVLATDMKVTPEPVDIRLIQDAYSNAVALLQAQSPAMQLKVEGSFTVERAGTRALDLPLHVEALEYPFAYADEDLIALQYYWQPYYDDPTDELNPESVNNHPADQFQLGV